MEPPSGRISGHFSGLGTVTREMVEQRARELGRINGHGHFTEADWLEAKRELLGTDHQDEPAEGDSVAGLTRWDEEPGTSGHHIPNSVTPDEQTFAEQLVEEGVNEAEHEQMLEGSRPEREDEK